jgi:hypothetical protein
MRRARAVFHKYKTWVVLSPAFLIVAAGLLAFWLALQPPEPPPPINIDAEQFNNALGKWKQAGVEEYKEVITRDTVMFLGNGTWELHVRVEGGNEKVVSSKQLSGPGGLPDVPTERLEDPTIGRLFEQVDSFMKAQPALPLDSKKGEGFYLYYDVAFDDELGYPKKIDAQAWTSPNALVSDVGQTLIVNSLTLIK